MTIIEPRQRQDLADRNTAEAYKNFNDLVTALQQKQLPATMVDMANEKIDEVNRSMVNGKEFTRLVKRHQRDILKTLEKDMKLVPKNHYRNTWLAVGMTAFGLPFGVVLGTALKNMGMLGLGLPIGMAIGIAVGGNLDKKAAAEGKQLDFEPKM